MWLRAAKHNLEGRSLDAPDLDNISVVIHLNSVHCEINIIFKIALNHIHISVNLYLVYGLYMHVFVRKPLRKRQHVTSGRSIRALVQWIELCTVTSI